MTFKLITPPTTVKGIRSFLGHAIFYRRFIKDFSKIARPLCRLLEKDTRFNFDDSCKAGFQEIKIRLVQAPIMAAPEWNQGFEVMCDASDFAIGAVLGKEKRKYSEPYIMLAEPSMKHKKTIPQLKRKC